MVNGYSACILRQKTLVLHSQSHLVCSLDTYNPVRIRVSSLLSVGHYSCTSRCSEHRWRDGSADERACSLLTERVEAGRGMRLRAARGSGSRGFDFFWLLWILYSLTCTDTWTYIYTHNFKIQQQQQMTRVLGTGRCLTLVCPSIHHYALSQLGLPVLKSTSGIILKASWLRP